MSDPTPRRRDILAMSDSDFNRIGILAKMYAASSFNAGGRNKEGDYFLLMVKGYEVGFSLTAAVDYIQVIQGKPCISAAGMLALIQASDEVENVTIEGNDQECTVTIKRRGRAPHAETFTLDMARKMGLDTRDQWRKMPALMLKWRAVSFCARACCPDIIGGMYTSEEMHDVTEGNERPQAQISVQQRAELPPPAPADDQPAAPAEPPPWYQTASLQRLVDRAHKAGYIEAGQGANDLLALLGNDATWANYATVAEAGTAIKAAVEAIKASVPPSRAPSDHATYEHATSAHADQAGQQKGKVSWLRYNGGDKPRITAKVGDTYASFWRGRAEFAAMCGEAWALATGIDTWEQSDQWRDVPPITVTIAPAQNPNFWDIVDVEPVGYSGPIPPKREASPDRKSADANELPF